MLMMVFMVHLIVFFFDHYKITSKNMIPVKSINNQEENKLLIKSHVFGPTCDSLDLISNDVPLIEMEIGEWLLFNEFGAYTLSAASNFNGFKTQKYHYFWLNDVLLLNDFLTFNKF